MRFWPFRGCLFLEDLGIETKSVCTYIVPAVPRQIGNGKLAVPRLAIVDIELEHTVCLICFYHVSGVELAGWCCGLPCEYLDIVQPATLSPRRQTIHRSIHRLSIGPC